MRSILLTFSLLTNLLLAVYLFWPAPAGPDSPPRATARDPGFSIGARPEPSAESTSGGSVKSISHLALESFPANELITALREAGVPEDLIRAIVTAHVGAGTEARSRELVAALPQVPYWKASRVGPTLSADQQAELRDRTIADQNRVRELLGTPPTKGGEVFTMRARYGTLPLEQIASVQRIQEDYAILAAKVRGSGPASALLPAEREQLAMLEVEKDRDIRAALTPEQYEDFNFRTSAAATYLRNHLRAFEPTEAEFRAMYAVQEAFEQKYSLGTGLDSTVVRARSAAQPQLLADLRATLSPERQAEFERVKSAPPQSIRP